MLVASKLVTGKKNANEPIRSDEKKWAILSELHLGRFAENDTLVKESIKWLIESIKKINPSNVIICGNTFDTARKHNHSILLYNQFIDLIKQILQTNSNLQIHVLIGPQDLVLFNEKIINLLQPFSSFNEDTKLNPVHIYQDTCSTGDLDGISCLFLPYTYNNNNNDKPENIPESIIEKVENQDKTIVFGEFTIHANESVQGIDSICNIYQESLQQTPHHQYNTPIKLEQLLKFKQVFVGGLHTSFQYSQSKVYNIGSLYQMESREAGDEKRGLLIYDVDNDLVQFEANPFSQRYIFTTLDDIRPKNNLEKKDYHEKTVVVLLDQSNEIELFDKLKKYLIHECNAQNVLYRIIGKNSHQKQQQPQDSQPADQINHKLHNEQKKLDTNSNELIPLVHEFVQTDTKLDEKDEASGVGGDGANDWYHMHKNEIIQYLVDIIKQNEMEPQSSSRFEFDAVLSKLEIENFLGVKGLITIHIDKLNDGIIPIIGRNSMGKSSVFDAICWCLFLKMPRTTKLLINMPINMNSQSCRVKVSFQNGIEVERIRMHKKTILHITNQGKLITENDDDSDLQNDIIQKTLAVNYEEFIKVVFASNQLFFNFFDSRDDLETRLLLEKFLGFEKLEKYYQIVENQHTIECQQLKDIGLNATWSEHVAQLKLKIQACEKDIENENIKLVEFNTHNDGQNIVESDKLKALHVKKQQVEEIINKLKTFLQTNGIKKKQQMEMSLSKITKLASLIEMYNQLKLDLQFNQLEQENTQLKVFLNKSGHNMGNVLRSLNIVISRNQQIQNDSDTLGIIYNNVVKPLEIFCETISETPSVKNIAESTVSQIKQHHQQLTDRYSELEKEIIELQNDFSSQENNNNNNNKSKQVLEISSSIWSKKQAEDLCAKLSKELHLPSTQFFKQEEEQLLKFENELHLVNQEIVAIETSKSNHSSEIMQRKNSIQIHQQYLVKLKQELEGLTHKMKDSSQIQDLMTKHKITRYWREKLSKGIYKQKNGFRTFCISKWIPTLNSMISQITNMISHGNEFMKNIHFQFLDNLNLVAARDSGEIKTRSSGQKQLANIAIYLALLNLAQSRSSFKPSFIFLDEILDSLDAENQFVVQLIISDWIKFTEKPIRKAFVISHSDDIQWVFSTQLIRASISPKIESTHYQVLNIGASNHHNQHNNEQENNIIEYKLQEQSKQKQAEPIKQRKKRKKPINDDNEASRLKQKMEDDEKKTSSNTKTKQQPAATSLLVVKKLKPVV